MSVAVIDRFEIVWAKGYGVARADSAMPVTPQTLFQAGSVSKPVAAVGALSLVESGKLVLDEDVNRRLTSWKVPDSPFIKDQKVTLRRILTHTAGTSRPWLPGLCSGCATPDAGPGAERRETGEHGARGRDRHTRQYVAILRRRGVHRAAANDGCHRPALSRDPARAPV
jgi:CubicO group peptidase (beta-lactamase class C family)